MEVDAAARQVLERGFTSLPGLLPPARVDSIRAAMRARWARHGSPPAYARDDVRLADDAEITPVGFTVTGLLDTIPEAAELLLEPALRSLFGALLGEGFELELVSGILTDHTRPFFFWHSHVGGIDGADYRRRPLPRFERCERIACTFYLTPLDEAHGAMLLSPRAIADPTEAPHEARREPWPDAVRLHLPAGSAVVLDQATWHAVTPMAREGVRVFIGSFVRRAGLAPPRRVDAAVARARAADPRLARAYAGALP
ncbi:MAG TPA: hypothetical protein RMH99_11585 [Sandaracinaceae bacterium LLY-WYZ-13_1]|nr:hypothetical protein [Sandaracinaceae bacterium LLY-WYZ-13_1]